LAATRRIDEIDRSSPIDASDGYWPGVSTVQRPSKFWSAQNSQRPRSTMTDAVLSLKP
jgi:hypothetical protein